NIISEFIELTPATIDKMNLLLNAKDWKGLGKEAHKLKPDLACIGAVAAEKIISEIETLSNKEQTLNLLPELMNELTKACKTIYESLKQELKINEK
ncbi:MAG: Hpt domain-containing protein, partial [Bacteroidia bacterium]|nr:Hpt domain-containing protein [Bacteroidia bacterium]